MALFIETHFSMKCNGKPCGENRCGSHPVPSTTNKKSPDNRLRTFAAVHCQGQANLDLFQILRQIPRTSQHTVDFHALAFIVDAIEHQTGHLLSGILHHKMTTGARLMILVGACGAPNPAGNEYGKLEVIVLSFSIF
jgi:hypothetical protein